MEKARYIAVEGPIGVGKTSLTEFLVAEFKGRVLLEDVDNNPFLNSFYQDRKKFAFQTQLFFLLSRYKQQKDLSQQELFNSTVIADYLFAKDKIFAYLNLDENELSLYEQIYRLLDARIPKPDLVIYLQARPEVLIERIKKRSKAYEANIEEDYIEKLVDTYNKYFFYYTDTPLLVINTSDIDFVSHPEDLANVVKEIRSIKGGVQHYIPVK
ncbi:MAG: deoxyadenosine kinase [Deltaproteobacteria bacterium RIFCSPLOWO2_12_FULL_43_16]|nr:MAG: deoxyadenosine kinase [Deltaproteobacteria bacterium GWA2_43_19]OGQ09811.1 MAG: deoxyadenosine kinase [Deltaproteobacteria bacterium RIFCSPHIGHO2_02_FULL_43_33]OGQ35152.1 MAG: deoxyadenosine kinase [Deltaproteobacteria bacterium RIFCSPLOWO2_01_FULL_42_9]OGQ58334.1 MAG: deoxyadenosine kinase [Deltaproteobacteria bacterium RIFCSPLOWO2_12_FULL_43_16]HBR18015.1 deoxynucleoside kinase [Deltaproteobacteria bacterium]